MFHVVLYQPEIPPNTGNAIRLCANTGCQLHLIEPLGFSLDDAKLRRAGLDYHEYAGLQVHRDLDAALAALPGARWWVVETAQAQRFDTPRYAPGDVFLFGRETTGLPRDVLDCFDASARISLPMQPGQRSLNLSNAVAVTVFEAWRQSDFALTAR